MSSNVNLLGSRNKEIITVFLVVVTLVIGGIIYRSMPVSAAIGTASVSDLPNYTESQWGKWTSYDVGKWKFPTVQVPFSMGQKVVFPNQIAIQIDEVDRNWQPQAWQVSPNAHSRQDDTTNKEVILVRFTVTNLSSMPMGYNDQYFSLIRNNGHEQRVADLDDLTGDQYGAFDDTNPWLTPGATKHSFVPFIVNKGEQHLIFVYYDYKVDWTQNSGPQYIQVPGSTKMIPNATPNYVGIARIPFTLSSISPSTTQVASPTVITFSSDSTFTVSGSNVYSH